MENLTTEKLRNIKLKKSNLNFFAESRKEAGYHVTEVLSDVITKVDPVHIKQVYSIGSLGASAFDGADFYGILKQQFPGQDVYLLCRKGYNRIKTIEKDSIFLHYTNTSEKYYVAVGFEPLDNVLDGSQKTYRENFLRRKDTKKAFETLIEPTLEQAIEKENTEIKHLHYDPLDKQIYITPSSECTKKITELLTKEYGNILVDNNIPFKLDMRLTAKFVIDIDALTQNLQLNNNKGE